MAAGGRSNHDRRFEEIVAELVASDPADLATAGDQLVAHSQHRTPADGMPSGWYIIRVELTSGRAETFDPPPGRDLLVSPNHTFRQLAELISACFARWDLGHLYAFRMADGTRIGTEFDDPPSRVAARTKLARRHEDEVFEYEFDFGDGWVHRCTVLEVDVTPEDSYGVRPRGPVAVWGWGSMPDQYGRTTPDGGDEGG
jgi:hypothetical protein